MANKPFDPTEDEILAALEAEDSLSDEIVRKWDPSRLLKLVAKRAGRGEKLDETTRRRYERKLGVDLGNVRIYTGEFAEEVTKAHRAEAVTIGTTGMILMGGSPSKSMAGASGRALLAHELTHVAQEQRSVQRKASFGEATPLATEEHEAEAEAMEAEELADASADGNRDGENPEERAARLREIVRKRVVDMLAEDERGRLMRNGPEGWRP
jgi:hypothetical protein